MCFPAISTWTTGNEWPCSPTNSSNHCWGPWPRSPGDWGVNSCEGGLLTAEALSQSKACTCRGSQTWASIHSFAAGLPVSAHNLEGTCVQVLGKPEGCGSTARRPPPTGMKSGRSTEKVLLESILVGQPGRDRSSALGRGRRTWRVGSGQGWPQWVGQELARQSVFREEQGCRGGLAWMEVWGLMRSNHSNPPSEWTPQGHTPGPHPSCQGPADHPACGSLPS